MPNRCGIMHVRGSPPTAKVTSTELSEYCRNFESKMTAFLQPIATLSQEEFDKLGAKNAEAYPLFFFFLILIHFSSFLLLLELFSLSCFYCFLNLFKSVRQKNSFKPIHKSYQKINGCVRLVGKNLKDQISFENISSINMQKKQQR